MHGMIINTYILVTIKESGLQENHFTAHGRPRQRRVRDVVRLGECSAPRSWGVGVDESSACLGFGRIVVSEKVVPNILVIMV